MMTAESQITAPGHGMRTSAASSLRAGSPIAALAFSEIRRRAVLNGCKWDPQVGDIDTLASFPLVMSASEWQHLAKLATRLTAEALAAEEEVSHHPELLKHLGLLIHRFSFPRCFDILSHN
jgi:hypothetical protein